MRNPEERKKSQSHSGGGLVPETSRDRELPGSVRLPGSLVVPLAPMNEGTLKWCSHESSL